MIVHPPNAAASAIVWTQAVTIAMPTALGPRGGWAVLSTLNDNQASLLQPSRPTLPAAGGGDVCVVR